MFVASCSPADVATTTSEGTTSSSGAETTTTTPDTTTTADGEIQDHLDWVVSLLNGGDITVEEYEARFTDEFRAQVPYETAFLPILTDLRAFAPYEIVERSGTGSGGSATIVGTDGTEFVVSGEVDDRGQFSTLLVEPGQPPTLEDPPATVEEAFSELAELGAAGGLSAEIVDGECLPVEALSESEPVPLGSVFKLYVLAAVGEAIASGTISWDDEIVIREEMKSIPSGELQNRPDGSTVTVLEAAQLMISISDNTATDLLIDLLGREVVEQVQGQYGNGNAPLNTPFLTTRELTALKVGPASGLRTPQWIEGGEADRRAILEQISDITVADLPLGEWTSPIDPDLVEWFASPEDLCVLAVGLISLAGDVPEIASILEINPGIPAPEGSWDVIWFKGGSEPGLLAAWWVTQAEGRTFFTFGSVVDPQQEIDQTRAILLIAAARDLMATG